MNRTILRHPEVLERLRELAPLLPRPMRFMEVCGTHTVNAFRSGLHSLLPENVSLLSGPGCPVCVTSQGDIDLIVQVASLPNVTLCTYGDMIRVTGHDGSLADARAAGADVRIIYSALDAVKFASENPRRQVVFAAVGFETTTPPSAVAVLEADKQSLDNFTVLASHKLIMPAMRALLSSGEVEVDGFVCPGHVAIITGSRVFQEVVDGWHLPCVITGFEGPQIAAAILRLVELTLRNEPALENLYPQAVTDEGNTFAMKLIDKVFEPVDATWRGLALLSDSGLALRSAYKRYDARTRFELVQPEERINKACACGDVITGRISPGQCRLFGTVCTPARPMGPCMVSSEGTCSAWFKYGRQSAAATAARQPAEPQTQGAQR